MKRPLFLFLAFLLSIFSTATFATHIVGGELVYEWLGGDQYSVTLIVYRDCNGGQADFDNPAPIGIFDINNTLLETADFFLDSVVDIQSSINSSCVTLPSDVCTEAGYYTQTLTLPPVIGGYTLAYQRCCRNDIVQNIVAPGDVGATITATIPGSNSSPENTSPFWNQLPPLYVCVNLPFVFDHSATDADGDSLIYSLCTPFDGASPNNPAPTSPSSPPYDQIVWQAPFSLSNLLGGPEPLTINPNTGQLNATPNAEGTYLIGMCVQEYRNGVLLGQTRRELQVSVVDCEAPVAMPDDLNEITPNSFVNCTEFVEFSATNSDGFSIWWDFGDPTTTTDQSTLQAPTWTYPGPGVYDLTLVVFNPANPNDPLCTDTVITQVTIQDTVIPDAGLDTSACGGFSVQIGTAAVPGWTYSWSPTSGLSNPNIAQPQATVTQQTVYTLIATDAEGCTGSDMITVSLLPNSDANAGADVEICPDGSVQLSASGGDTYLWTPPLFIDDVTISDPTVNPPTTSEYYVAVTNSDGCVGIDTVLVEVLEPQLVVSENITLCLGDTVQLSATGGNTYFWSPDVNISNVNSADPQVYPTVTTTYVLNAVDLNSCEVVDSVTVTVQSLPIANAGSDQTICLGETAQLSASGGTVYSWTPSATLSDSNIADPLAEPQTTTEYIVTVSDDFGCSSADSVSVEANPLPVVSAGSDQTVCLNDPAQLLATGATDYTWTPPAGLNNPNIFNPIATPLFPTEYVVTGTDANGCTDSDTVLVDVFVVDALGDTIICIGDEAQLGAIGGTSWSWTPTTGLSNPTAQFPTADPTTTTVYTVVADDGTGCTASDTVTVEVNPLPTAFAGFNQGVCAGSTAQLNATGGVTYQWTPTTGLSDPNIANPVVTFTTDSATYYVTVTDIIGCANTDSVTLWQEQLPNATAGPDTIICFGQSADLIATGGTTYSWNPAAGLNNPTISNPTATPLTTTTYTVTIGQPTGNLVFNGDFTLGNVGFNSDYIYATQLNPEGLYSVVTDANAVHNAFQGTGNTGNAPLDSFLVVNGAGTPNQNVWCQTVSVSPNTDYYFGSWVSTVVEDNPAILQFSINGQTLGAPFTAPFNINNWIEFSETWNSGNQTSATICVVNQNTATGGNDFALDDISFSTICTNTAEITVTVNPLPVADAGADQQLCVGDTTQLNATGGGDYQWIPPTSLSDPTNATTDASPTTTTVYTVIITDNIGCSDMNEMTLTVNPLPNASAGPNQELCIGESVILQGSGGTSYQWNPPTFLDDATLQLPTATADITTTYTVTVTDMSSCANEDEMTVTVNALPQIDAGLDSLICENATIILQATGGSTYLWTPLIGLSDPQSATPTASPQDSITHFLTGTDGNGCVNTDSVTITIFSITAGPDSVICLNDTVQAFVSGGTTFLWTPTQGVSDPTLSAPFLFPEISTNFTVTVTSEFGCVAEAEVNIDILTLPVATFEARFDPGCEGIFADLSNSSENSETYFWVFGNGNSSSETDPTTIFPAGFGSVITLYAYNNDSLCVDSTTVDYSGQWFGNDTIEIVYPNVFTPNFDGLNDCFKPGFDGQFSECYALSVYNRWGALIFESTAGQEHCWDGRTRGGKLVSEGTYYYVVSLKGYEHGGYVNVIH